MIPYWRWDDDPNIRSLDPGSYSFEPAGDIQSNSKARWIWVIEHHHLGMENMGWPWDTAKDNNKSLPDKYTWNPNDPCFDWKGPSFGGSKDPKEGTNRF